MTDDVEPSVGGGVAHRRAPAVVGLIELRPLGVEPANEIEIVRVEHGEKDRRASDVVLGGERCAELEGALDRRAVAAPHGVEQALLDREGLRLARLAGSHRQVAFGRGR